MRPPASRIVSSSSARPPANAWRKAASENATARPICFAYVAATIAARVSPGQFSGQRSACTCSSAARALDGRAAFARILRRCGWGL